MDTFNLKKYITEGKLLKEDAFMDHHLKSDFEKIKASNLFSEVRLEGDSITLSGGQERYYPEDDKYEYSKKLFETPQDVITALKDVKGRKFKMNIVKSVSENEEEDDGEVTEYKDYSYTLTPVK